MAHNCPDCGRVCYCGGDGDMEIRNTIEAVDDCECECWMDDGWEWDDDYIRRLGSYLTDGRWPSV